MFDYIVFFLSPVLPHPTVPSSFGFAIFSGVGKDLMVPPTSASACQYCMKHRYERLKSYFFSDYASAPKLTVNRQHHCIALTRGRSTKPPHLKIYCCESWLFFHLFFSMILLPKDKLSIKPACREDVVDGALGSDSLHHRSLFPRA